MTERWRILGRVVSGAGGVSDSAKDLRDALHCRGHGAEILDLGSLRLIGSAILRRIMRTKIMHQDIYWASSSQAAIWKQAPVAFVVSRSPILFIHAASARQLAQIREKPRTVRLLLSVFKEIYVNNRQIQEALADVGVSTTVASAYTPSIRNRPKHKGGRGMIAFAYASGTEPDHYGIDILLDALKLLPRGQRRLSLVLYGSSDGPVPALPQNVEVFRQMPREDLFEMLAHYDVLVRPTRTDGDSILVRQALELGLVVVATDVVSRPAGCVLSAADARSLAETLAGHTGRVSDGTGLGPPFVELLAGSCPSLDAHKVQ